MELHVRHTTTYRYDEPVPYGLQQLRMTPTDCAMQRVVDWDVEVGGGRIEVAFDDHHANRVLLVLLDADTTEVTATTSGVVETTDNMGISAPRRGRAPLWLYLRPTDLTRPGDGVEALVADVGPPETPVAPAFVHTLSDAVRDAVTYEAGTTAATSSAEEALAAGRGVCQDHAHVFLGAARLIGLPARYVSGYLMTPEQNDQSASHAWAEVWLDSLGWVTFDVSNGTSADERYVRLAVGADYLDAAPISGLRYGGGEEDMDVSVQVRADQ